MNKEERKNFGKRTRDENLKRFIALIILFLLTGILEGFIGDHFEKQHKMRTSRLGQNWAINYYNAPDGSFSIPPKTNGKKRILYISNSHAKTGGCVATHLYNILEKLAPGQFEVLDLSDAGIFAPEILQRTLLGLDLNPDAIILAVAYISFSDRMKLSLQAHSVRSFFKDGIFRKLSLGFWLRNYDIGLYSNSLMAHHLRLYRYRNDIRNIWERPIVHFLQSITNKRPILFLDMDEQQRWKFPDGYDNNLFQWRLYAAGREKHLEDLREAVMRTHRAKVPLFAFNLPIHWEKSLHPHNPVDVQYYRASLAEIFQNATAYVDYEKSFPKDFTTYDALHPTYHGARLHALDICFRLAKQEFFKYKISDKEILDKYLAMELPAYQKYIRCLNSEIDPLKVRNFRRYDISDPENAHDLLRRLLSHSVGSEKEKDHLYNLSLRIRYWTEGHFTLFDKTNPNYSEFFRHALQNEISQARKRIFLFKEKLINLQNRRLSKYPIPAVTDAELIGTDQAIIGRKIKVLLFDYLTSKEKIRKISMNDGRPIAYIIKSIINDLGYVRLDILGDRSFLMLQAIGSNSYLPSWVIHSSPVVRFGT